MKTATFTSQKRFSAPQGTVMQNATIGLVTEISPFENRVALNPEAVREFALCGHKIYIQNGAGSAAGFEDYMYIQAGATMMQNPQNVYQKSQIMIKVMQPLASEYNFIQQQQIIFCFLNSNNKEFIQHAMQRQVVVITYECIMDTYTTPIMDAMSELSGHLAVQHGMKYMEKQMGGMGMFMGKIAGVQSANVLILGGGIAAVQAARFASNLGANVTLMDVSSDHLNRIDYQIPASVDTIVYTNMALEKQLPYTDILIGAVMPEDFKAHNLVNKEQIKLMRPKSVLIDLAMEYGGNFESSQMTTWERPTFIYNDIIHFCVRNITYCVPRTASQAMCYAVLPYALQVANMGWRNAAVHTDELRNGITVAEKCFTNELFATYFNQKFTPIEIILEQNIKMVAEKTQDGAWNLKHQLHMLHNYGQVNTNKMYTVEA